MYISDDIIICKLEIIHLCKNIQEQNLFLLLIIKKKMDQSYNIIENVGVVGLVRPFFVSKKDYFIGVRTGLLY